LIYGFAGMIDYIIDKMIEEMNQSADEVMVVATGGFANLISAETKKIKVVDKYLTLEGLRIIYERNKVSN
jgi:Putative transcriptional regulator, homolog of Bvg accessory factor